MGETVRLGSARDGFEYEAYHASPGNARRGGLVVCQAVWGVTPHLRALADGYAEDGYEVLVPSLYDRWEPGFPDKDSDPAMLQHRKVLAERSGWGTEVLDFVQAAIDALAPPVFMVGYCNGGTVAWLAASRCHGLAAVASFYGGQIVRFLHDEPKVPIVLHLGKTDELIPPADVEAIRARHPDVPIHMYEAGHAFVAPNGYHADSARLSRLRTLQQFANNGGRGEV